VTSEYKIIYSVSEKCMLGGRFYKENRRKTLASRHLKHHDLHECDLFLSPILGVFLSGGECRARNVTVRQGHVLLHHSSTTRVEKSKFLHRDIQDLCKYYNTLLCYFTMASQNK